MAEEIQEAVQIIRVAYDGIEIAMKVGSGGISAIQKALDVLKTLIEHDKVMGKTGMRNLLAKGGDLQVLQISESDVKKFNKYAKKYGILYSVMPDMNKGDGKVEILFHTEATPRINMMIQKMRNASVSTFDEYLNTVDTSKLAEITDYLKREKKGNLGVHTEKDEKVNAQLDGLIEKVGLYATDRQSISVDAIKENFGVEHNEAENVMRQLETIGVIDKKNNEGISRVIMDKDSFLMRIRGYRELSDRIKAIAASKNTDLSDVTISKVLIKEENERAIKTRVPGTYGDNVRYLWLRKENTMEIHNGKTILTFLDKTKDYKLYDEQNRVVEVKNGKELYKHYDKVESEVRERYEKAKKDPATKKSTKRPPNRR